MHDRNVDEDLGFAIYQQTELAEGITNEARTQSCTSELCENQFHSGLEAKRPVAQLAERRSPKPQVGGSMPSWPATDTLSALTCSTVG